MRRTALILGTLLFTSLPLVTAQAQPSLSYSKFVGTLPKTALSKAVLVGHHDPFSSLRLTVVLKLRNETELESFLKDVVDPSSPKYHMFLTPSEFTARYAPTPQQTNAVVQYLQAQGLHVLDVSPNNLLIHVEDKTGTIERAFSTTINDFDYHGRRVHSAVQEPRLRADMVQYVQNILGLENFSRMKSHLASPRTCDNSEPCDNPSPYKSYTPLQIAGAYDWPSILDTSNGAGVNIAIATALSSGVGSSQDYHTFWANFGLPDHTVHAVAVDGDSGYTSGMDESTLDVEYTGAMAPGASITVYVANGEITQGLQSVTMQDLLDVYNAIANANTSQVMSTSWGTMEDVGTESTLLQSADMVFRQLASQGISVFAASGDAGSSDGSNNNDTADYPASDPYVLAAGGTKLDLDFSTGAVTNETVWQESSSGFGATGGADSAYFPKPPWQTGTGVTISNHRKTSDLSMDADPLTAYFFYLDGQLVTGGGTSFVAPELAGLFAVEVSRTGSRFGQAAPAVYADANSANYATDFRDITSGDNGQFSAGTGWDYPTGWGVPDANNLLANLNTVAASVPKAYVHSSSTDVGQSVTDHVFAYANGTGFGTLTYHVVAQPANGTVTMTASSGSFTYKPNPGFVGTDSFTYDAVDTAGTSNIAKVTITVAGNLSAPVNVSKEYTGCTNGSDYYVFFWNNGPNGTPNSYTADVTTDGVNWFNFYSGTYKVAQLVTGAQQQEEVRIAEKSGSFTGSYYYSGWFTTANCTPAQ